MNGIRIVINDVKTSNSFEMIKLSVKIISITKGMILSETELHALTYFIINGFNKTSREDLVSSKLVRDKQAEYNLTSKFRKMGIIVQNGLKEDVLKDFKIPNNDLDCIKLELLIKK